MTYRIFTTSIFALACLLFTASEGVAQRTAAKPLGYQQRIELAKKLLADIKAKATKDKASPEQRLFFTTPWSSIDPEWTANFIADNPPTGSPNGLYDHAAVMNLMTKANELDDATTLKLLNSSSGNNMMLYTYVGIALDHITDDRSELRSKLLQLTFESGHLDVQALDGLVRKLHLARKFESQAMITSMESEIDEFFRSGTGKKSWSMIEKLRDRGHQSHQYAMHLQHVPQDMLQEFLPPISMASSVYLANATLLIRQMNNCENKVRAAQLREEAKASLAKVKRIDFGRQPYQQITAAGMLGIVAKLNTERALELSEEAPTQHAKIWARLVVSLELAKTDRDRASKLIRECYQAAAKLNDQRDPSNYNFPGIALMTKGLTVVQSASPELLDECLELSFKTVATHVLQPNQSTERFFNCIAILAKYDVDRARQLFDEHSKEVDVSSAGAFFKALLVFEPEQIWDEYQQVPTSDERNHQLSIRNAIIGSLIAPDDKAFWEQISHSGFLAIPE